ncbi:MAG: hypothetical protein ACYSUI_21445 [Planctomycetota bacterium]
MNDIQVGRYSELLHKLLGITEGSPAPSLAPELLATLVLETDRPEWGYLGGERLCWGQVTPTPAVGARSLVQLHNNHISDLLIVVDGLELSTGANLTFVVGHLDTLASGGGVTVGTTGFRDGRYARGVAASGRVYSDEGAALALDRELYNVRVLANTSRFIPLSVVLPPGTGFAALTFTTNQAFTGSFLWRERAMTSNEAKQP